MWNRQSEQAANEKSWTLSSCRDVFFSAISAAKTKFREKSRINIGNRSVRLSEMQLQCFLQYCLMAGNFCLGDHKETPIVCLLRCKMVQAYQVPFIYWLPVQRMTAMFRLFNTLIIFTFIFTHIYRALLQQLHYKQQFIFIIYIDYCFLTGDEILLFLVGQISLLESFTSQK